jgi:cholesterol oxidase
VHHANLDSVTHAALHELFGTTNLTMMSHLSRIARQEELVTASGASYLGDVGRLDLPITFLHGSKNLVWLPASSKRTYDWLQRELGTGKFGRTVFPTYGHQDLMIGHAAAIDVFPSVLAHLSRVGA